MVAQLQLQQMLATTTIGCSARSTNSDWPGHGQLTSHCQIHPISARAEESFPPLSVHECPVGLRPDLLDDDLGSARVLLLRAARVLAPRRVVDGGRWGRSESEPRGRHHWDWRRY
jgi:hypothetical protein